MVFDKPAGVLVIPSPKKEKWTMVTLVNQQYAKDPNQWMLHPCHRLDRDTSGAIMFAKGKANQQRLMALFEARKVHKKYIAIVQGSVKRREGTITASIQSFEDKKFSNKQSVPAVTKYRVITDKKRFTIVEVEPITGRTNQIRIHFKHIGHPLLGERKYAFRKDFSLKFRRTALHAAYLRWVDPLSHQRIVVQSPLAKDMEEVIKQN